MSVNFPSGIVPLSPETISKPPKYTNANAQQPAASTPMNTEEPAKKKSHWFLKTIGAIVVVGAALGLGRKFVPALRDINLSQVADEGAKWYQKGRLSIVAKLQRAAWKIHEPRRAFLRR